MNHSFSSSYYPQGNGLVEFTNKQLIKILKIIIDDNPWQWHTLLPYTLWEDKTTTKVVTGVTHFQLVYGQEFVMPMELQLASLKLASQTKEFHESDLINKFHMLLILDEQRNHALNQIEKRKKIVKKYFDKTEKYDTFEIGQ